MISDEDTIRLTNNEINELAKTCSAEAVDDAITKLLQATNRHPRSGIYLLTVRMLLKPLLYIIKWNYNGGSVRNAHVCFSLEPVLFECYKCMLDAEMRASVCFALRIVQNDTQNSFVVACNRSTSMHIMAWDLSVFARHGVQPKDEHLRCAVVGKPAIDVYWQTIVRNSRFLKTKAEQGKVITTDNNYDTTPAGTAEGMATINTTEEEEEKEEEAKPDSTKSRC